MGRREDADHPERTGARAVSRGGGGRTGHRRAADLAAACLLPRRRRRLLRHRRHSPGRNRGGGRHHALHRDPPRPAVLHPAARLGHLAARQGSSGASRAGGPRCDRPLRDRLLDVRRDRRRRAGRGRPSSE